MSSANATTVVLPSGAGEIQVGYRLVLGMMAKAKTTFNAVVVMPNPLVSPAIDFYTAADWMGMNVTILSRRFVSGEVREMARELLEVGSFKVIVLSYEDMVYLNLAQRRAKDKVGSFDLVVFVSAQVVRAGGYLKAGIKDGVIVASKRAYISSRRLVGLAPGAMLRPGQEFGYPGEETIDVYGNEVYNLNHDETEARQMSVPLSVVFLSLADIGEVVKELAALHTRLGVRTIQLVPRSIKLTHALDAALRSLTDGNCTVTTGDDHLGGSIDAIIVSGSRPDYVVLAEEFCRLARWEPGKKGGFILLAETSKNHTIAMWRALAIEDAAVEEGLSEVTQQAGMRDRALTWNELPHSLRRYIHDDSDRKRAEVAVNRGVRALGSDFDMNFGRLLAYKEKTGNCMVESRLEFRGYKLGRWVAEQRRMIDVGTLHATKVARLKRIGLMINVRSETFAMGLAELRKFVKAKKTRFVPVSYKADNGFSLGEWVANMRIRQKVGDLDAGQVKLLQQAFFLFEDCQVRVELFSHPEDFDASSVTRGLEEYLREHRWMSANERTKIFRQLVLKHHPDVSQDKYAEDAIQFLSDAKSWFLKI